MSYAAYLNLFEFLAVKDYKVLFTNIGEEKESGGVTRETHSKDKYDETMQFLSFVMMKAISAQAAVPVYVFIIAGEGTVKRPQFQKLVGQITEKAAHMIIISKYPLEARVHKMAAGIPGGKKIRLSGFKHFNFVVDPRRHVLVGRHTICSAAEVERIRREEHISELAELPKILSRDPQCIWLWAEPGDVIRIENKTHTGPTIGYRFVIS